ncbi:MAG: hypothetical protein ACKV19_19445 [Verrucomicrobiales bacterium]
MPARSFNITLLALAASLAGTAVSCRPADRVEITLSRPRHTTEAAPRLDVPLIDSLPAAQEYRWTLPPGWMEKPATQFRRANFAFGSSGEGECYLSMTQGSELENVNRWRLQMGQPPLDEEAFAALPRRDIFGFPAAFVDLTGTYTGAAGAAPVEGTRLLGVVRADHDVTLTVKMTGPADLVASHAANFDTFVASLRFTPAYNP